jgi:hypothetical protein
MDLKTVKRELPDSFKYRGKKFIQSFYSSSRYGKRSNEIIWERADHKGQVYMIRNNIEYIPYQKLKRVV